MSRAASLLFAACLGLPFAACGGNSVKHIAVDEDPRTPLDCEDIRDQTAVELERLQHCEDGSECGQVLEGTSCGCSHDLVARLDADPSHFRELTSTVVGGERCVEYGGACDCPDTDGFACEYGRCGWSFIRDPAPLSDCQGIRKLAADELASIRSCTTDAECGQILDASSCGCALGLVARLDADASAFHELVSRTVNGEQCVDFGTDCDCPKSAGFECAEGRCNYRSAT